MITIGLTGGIGSGKSYISNIFSSLGAIIYDTDHEAKRIMISDTILIEKIKELFGEESYLASGELNRGYLASQIFTDRAKLEEMNAAVHPAVKRDFGRFKKENSGKLIVLESAILIESGFTKEVDFVVGVVADRDLRVDRATKRDNTNREAIERRISSQISEQELLLSTDFMIENNENSLLLPQISSILKKIGYC